MLNYLQEREWIENVWIYIVSWQFSVSGGICSIKSGVSMALNRGNKRMQCKCHDSLILKLLKVKYICIINLHIPYDWLNL